MITRHSSVHFIQVIQSLNLRKSNKHVINFPIQEMPSYYYFFSSSFLVFTCKSVYISNNTGSDHHGCGITRKSPCETINYALSNSVFDKDVILLMSSFEIDQPLLIQQTGLIFKSDSPERATISSYSFLMRLSRNNDTDVFFEYIKFSNVLLLKKEHISFNMKINVSNCQLEGSSQFVVFNKDHNEKHNEKFVIDLSFISSTINIQNFLINQESQKFQMKVSLENSLIMSGAIQATASVNLSIQRSNVRMTDQGSMNYKYKYVISIYGSYGANINIHNVNVTIKDKESGFLKCFKCTLNSKNLHFSDSEIQTSLYLNLVSGRIEGFSMKDINVTYRVFSIIESNVTFPGLNLFENLHTYQSLFFGGKKTLARFNSLELRNCNSKTQMMYIQNEAHVAIKTFHVSDSTSAYEFIRFYQYGRLFVWNLQFHKNIMHQVVLITGDNINTNHSRLSISSGDITRNKLVVNLFGIIDGIFEMHNTRLSYNSNKNGGHFNNLVTFIRGKSVLKNLKIDRNKYHAGIKARNSSLTVENVSFIDNEGISHGKAIVHEGEIPKQKHKVILRNIYVRVIDFDRYDSKSFIISIDMKDSSFIMDNVTIDITSMKYPFVSAIFIKFATLNLNSLQRKDIKEKAFKVYCPPSYNPSLFTLLQSDFYSEQVKCIPCSRGTYNLTRGSVNLYNVDNIDLDVITWKNYRPYTNRSRPLLAKCDSCPPGGNCTYGIKSQGNYFGQIKHNENGDQVVKFIPCPVSYCCSNQGKYCDSIKTCNFNRRGNLCGQCEEGFYESYFYTKCITNKKCSRARQRRFWGIYFGTSLVLTLIIFSLKDMAIIFVTSVEVIKEKVTKWKNERRNQKAKPDRNNNDNDKINQAVYNIPFEELPSKFIFSALFQITLSFFQMVSLLKFKTSANNNELMSRIINIFNLEIALKETETICPFESINVPWKNFIKYVLFMITMVTILLFGAIIFTLVSFVKCYKTKDYKNIFLINLLQVPFQDKLMLCFIKILIFGYKNISLFTIISLHCIDVGGTSVMYLSGNIKCYQPWQWTIVTLLILWVIPFPAALVLSYKMFDKRTIHKLTFLICLIFPFTLLLFINKHRKTKSHFVKNRTKFRALLYDLFEAPFRLTSTSDDGGEKTMYWWTAWRLYERLFIAVLVTFLIDPLFRMCVLAPAIVILLMLHYHLKPYREHLTLLSWMDISSYAFLLFYVVDNLFHSFTYIFDLPLENALSDNFQVLSVFEVVLTPLTVVFGFIVLNILQKLVSNLRLKKMN